MTENRPNEEPKLPQSERNDESRPQAPNNGLRRVTGVIRVSSPQEQLAIREVFAQEFAGPNISLKRPEPAKPIEELLVIPETVQVAVTRAAVPSEDVPTASTSEVDSWHDIAAENQPQVAVSSDIAAKDADEEDIAPEIRRSQDACSEVPESAVEIDPNAIMAPRVMNYDSAEAVPPAYEDAESHFLVSMEDTGAEGLMAQTLCAVAPQVSEAELAELETLAKEHQADVEAQAEQLAQEKAEAEAQAEQLAQEKAEAEAQAEQLAQEKAEAEAQAEQLAQKKAKAEAQAEQLAQEKAEAEAQAEQLAQEKAELLEAEKEALQAKLEAEQTAKQLADQLAELEKTAAELQETEPQEAEPQTEPQETEPQETASQETVPQEVALQESTPSLRNAQFAGAEVAVAIAGVPTDEVATQADEAVAQANEPPAEPEAVLSCKSTDESTGQDASTDQATEITASDESTDADTASETAQTLVEDGDVEGLEEAKKLSYAQRIGMQIEDWICAIGDFTIFACQVVWWLLRLPRRGTLIPCMHEIGIMSLPVIAMTGTFIGMVLAVQSYNQLKGFYLETRIGALINLSLVRELGPVLAATMLAGRIGSSMAAELGTMRVTEQIDALGSMGVNPIHYLVVPRFLSCMLLIPVLTIFADFMGIVGGAYFSVWIFHVDWHFYLTNSNKIVGSLDVFIGIFKSLFFGAAIGLIGCHRGFHSRAGAQGVGRAATEAFVFSFVTILLLDLALGILIESLIQFLPTMPRQL